MPVTTTTLDTPCREYQGARFKSGYGKRSGTASRRWGTPYVHRQIMAMAGHNIEGLVVMHRCDNPPCFRYDHLRLGTHADNHADMVAKGRGSTPPPPRRVGVEITHCPHGHEYTSANMVSNGCGLICRTCRDTRLRRRDRRKPS